MHLGEQMNLHEQIHLYEKRTDSYRSTNASKSTDRDIDLMPRKKFCMIQGFPRKL